MTQDPEKVITFLTEKLLQPIGIHLSKEVIFAAMAGEDTAVNDLQVSIYMLIANIIFSKNNVRESRDWVKKCNMDTAKEILALLGFDPFLFNLENDSQHLLVVLCWLIWRSDLFNSLYEPYLPKDDTYLPPYGVLISDPDDPVPKPLRDPPTDHNELTKRIQRLIGRISYQLQTLSDLEMARETLHWQIRSIDPDSDLYSLSLKTNPDLLSEHTEALKFAVENSPRLQAISKQEEAFYHWAFSLVDSLNIDIDPDIFERTRSLPCEWFPPLTHTPYTTHNQGVDDLQKAINEMNQKMDIVREKFSGILPREETAGLNSRQISLIQREIDDQMEALERLEEVKVEEKKEQKVSLIPELELTKYSDIQLERLIQVSERKCQKIAAKSCPEIAAVINKICDEMKFQPHGWKCDEIPKYDESDDFECDVDMQENIHQNVDRAPKKVGLKLVAPKQLARVDRSKQVKSRNEKVKTEISNPKKEIPMKKVEQLGTKKGGSKIRKAGRLPFKNQPDMVF